MKYMFLCFLLFLQVFAPLPIDYVFAEETQLTPNMIAGQSAILIDGTTGKVLFEKNPEVPMYPASITKIATGIYSIMEGNPDDLVTVSKRARNEEGTRVYLAEGEQVPLRKLEYGLLMNSGNDAATAIAEFHAGSNEAFAEKLNQFLIENVGVTNTHFTNPHGLHDPEHYTTASDMAKIAQFAMKNATFREIVATKRLPWHGEEWDTVIVNHNKMLTGYEGANGIKNGFTDQAGNTLVVSAKRGNTEFIAVTLKCPSSAFAYQDVTNMLDYGFEHFETRQVAKAGDTYSFTSGSNSENRDVYYVNSDLFATMPLHADYKQKVTVDGKLVITLPNGETESFSLARKDQPASSAGASEKASAVPRYAIFVCWLILNVLLVVRFIRWRRSKAKMKMMMKKNRQLQ